MALADSIHELTKRLTPGYTKDLFQSFSICGDCKTWQRFGELHDGGYLSCMDNMTLRAHTRKDNRNAPLALLAPLALGRKII